MSSGQTDDQAGRLTQLCTHLVRCVAGNDAPGFQRALARITEADLNIEAIDFLAERVVRLSPPWLPDRPEEVDLQAGSALANHAAYWARKYVAATRQQDEQGKRLSVNSLLDDPARDEERIVLFVISLCILVAVAERQADAAKRAGVSIDAEVGPHGLLVTKGSARRERR
jgi:hypothetical protein